MNFRHDIAKAKFEILGWSYSALSRETGLSKSTCYDFMRGRYDATASTIKTVFQKLDLDPSLALNFKVKLSTFRRAEAKAAR